MSEHAGKPGPTPPPSPGEAESLVERLATLDALADIPRDQLRWLVDHGRLRTYADGDALMLVDDINGLLVVLSGRLSVRVSENGVDREVREITVGRITGFLPYSKMTTPRGFLVADGTTECLLIDQTDIREMTSHCYEFTGACVQEMLARVRVFKAEDKRQEKMAALGRLSAGLAHELNNPASAAARAAGELDGAVLEVAEAARALGAAGLDADGLARVGALQEATERGGRAPTTALGRAEVEDRCMDWLDARGIDPTLAYPLVESGASLEDLDAAGTGLSPEALGVALRYVAARATARALATGIVSGATRIHSLVAAVKKHTHMDRAPGLEAIRLGEHLADAVTLLSSKASEKNVSVDLAVASGLPAVMGTVADLNQVWIHLLDNAIDAAPDAGHVLVESTAVDGFVAVRVVDDGSGISDEDQERVFEPFFTTKDVGQGRGLGLDIVRTVVAAHKGVVHLSSSPGETEFRVTLPAAPAEAART